MRDRERHTQAPSTHRLVWGDGRRHGALGAAVARVGKVADGDLAEVLGQSQGGKQEERS